jgi:hypothetical protein
MILVLAGWFFFRWNRRIGLGIATRTPEKIEEQ